jgi:Zn-dependent alcohol dehydrogenase
VFVGAGGPEVRVNIAQFAGLVMQAKTLKGCLYGSADIRRDVPRILDYYRGGEFKLAEMVTSSFPLDEVNDAFAALDAGEVLTGVLSLA